MRYFAELGYKGTSYRGWQRQADSPSVQGAIEHALSTLLRAEIPITGAGRTDTGVHASYYVAHFDMPVETDDPASFLYHLNSILPHDIAIYSLTPVAEDAHARFDAVEREYKYYVARYKDPFRRDTAWIYLPHLDVESMNLAAESLLSAEDFTTFSKLHSGNKTNICKVSRAVWERTEEGLVFTIRADRFLRNMVRSIVGTLVDVGRGKISPDEFSDILASQDRSLASGSAPAQGLFLNDVRYPERIFTRLFQRHKTENWLIFSHNQVNL